jgi:hypothetical protein
MSLAEPDELSAPDEELPEAAGADAVAVEVPALDGELVPAVPLAVVVAAVLLGIICPARASASPNAALCPVSVCPDAGTEEEVEVVVAADVFAVVRSVDIVIRFSSCVPAARKPVRGNRPWRKASARTGIDSSEELQSPAPSHHRERIPDTAGEIKLLAFRDRQQGADDLTRPAGGVLRRRERLPLAYNASNQRSVERPEPGPHSSICRRECQ